MVGQSIKAESLLELAICGLCEGEYVRLIKLTNGAIVPYCPECTSIHADPSKFCFVDSFTTDMGVNNKYLEEKYYFSCYKLVIFSHRTFIIKISKFKVKFTITLNRESKVLGYHQ